MRKLGAVGQAMNYQPPKRRAAHISSREAVRDEAESGTMLSSVQLLQLSPSLQHLKHDYNIEEKSGVNLVRVPALHVS